MFDYSMNLVFHYSIFRSIIRCSIIRPLYDSINRLFDNSINLIRFSYSLSIISIDCSIARLFCCSIVQLLEYPNILLFDQWFEWSTISFTRLLYDPMILSLYESSLLLFFYSIVLLFDYSNILWFDYSIHLFSISRLTCYSIIRALFDYSMFDYSTILWFYQTMIRLFN